MNLLEYTIRFISDNEIAVLFAIIAVGLCFAFVHPASAAVISVAQGDRIYWNETADLSLAASWPDFIVARCAGDYSGCLPPDQIINLINGTVNIEKVFIDPKVFSPGTYWRWDGKWHSAENAIAFTVIAGRRPVNKTAYNRTETPSAIPVKDGPFHYIIARGDSPTVYTILQNHTEPCHLWIFSTTTNTYNILMNSSNGTYYHKFTEGDTYNIDSGNYQGYIQCEGKNGWQDIYLSDSYLDTPYDNRMVPDVPIMTWNLLNAKRQFDDLVPKVPKFDDELIPITVSVVEPTVTITTIEQDDKKLYVMGSTTWGNDSPITLRLDPDNYKLSRDIALHTWQTFTTGSIDAPRTFAMAFPLDRKELFVGMHEITSTVEKKGNTATSSYNFRISDVYVMPTPTPEAKRMIYGKDWEAIPVKVTLTPTPTPNETPDNWEEFVVITPTMKANTTVDVTQTSTITPNVTQRESSPIATQTIPVIPVNPIVPLAATGIAIALRREL